METLQEVVMNVARVAILVLCLCACTSTKRAAITPDPPAEPPSARVAVPLFGEWTTWSHDKKKDYMKATVVLAEKGLWAEYDPVRFANFTCKNCHGSGAADGAYRMPNPDLPKWPGGADAFRELKERNPKALFFMQQVVVPVTARLIGVKEFDFASHTGFSCFQCHTRG